MTSVTAVWCGKPVYAVQDDATQPAAMRTRHKFRRVFGLEPPANELRLRGPLRVPALG